MRRTRSRLCKEPVRLVIDFRPKPDKPSTQKDKKADPAAAVLKCVPAEKGEDIADLQPASEETQVSIPCGDEIGASSEAATPVEQVVKRKRGRPRKDPASTAAAKRLKFSVAAATDTPSGSTEGESNFPVTPYPGKTASNGRVPRPPNAFMIFGKENRRLMSQKHPGSTNKDISKLLGEQWQKLDEESKQPYRESAKKALLEHREKHPNYQYVPTEARLRKRSKEAAKVMAEQKRSEVKAQQFWKPQCDLSEANKENIPPCQLPQAPAGDPARIITELFVAPPGYEDVEIEGLDKFVLWENKLIPYKEWLGAEGDVKRLSGNYTQVPEQLMQPITNCVVAGTNVEQVANQEQMRLYPAHEGQRDSGEVVNTMVWNASDDQMTLNECNACPSSEADKAVMDPDKSGSEMDAQRLLHDLMTGDVRPPGQVAAVVVREEPEPEASAARRLFWKDENAPAITSDDEE